MKYKLRILKLFLTLLLLLAAFPAKAQETAHQVSFGKKIPLKNGVSLIFKKGNTDPFRAVKKDSSFSLVELHFQQVKKIAKSQELPMLHYTVHISPTFADFYWKLEDKKITPIAMVDFSKKEPVELLEPHVTYSRSKTIGQEKIVVSLLYDWPKNTKGPLTFRAKFKVDDQSYVFDVKE